MTMSVCPITLIPPTTNSTPKPLPAALLVLAPTQTYLRSPTPPALIPPHRHRHPAVRADTNTDTETRTHTALPVSSAQYRQSIEADQAMAVVDRMSG